jgi:hypothetical protein
MMASMKEPRQVDLLKKYDTVVSSGQSALRAFLTLNGGATVAFLAFIGHVMETGKMPVASGRIFVGAMQLFIYGTFLAVLAYGTIFLTNCLSQIDWRRSSNWMFGVTLLCGFASLGCFLVASWQAIQGFELANQLLAGKPK